MFTRPFRSWITGLALVALCACAVLTGCRKAEPRYRIGVSQCSDDDWRSQMNREMRAVAAVRSDVQLHFRHAADHSSRQVAQIDSFVSEGVNLIIVAPNEADTVGAAIERAEAAGIPVLVVDRQVRTARYTAFVGGDNLKVGRDAARYFVATHPEGGTVWQVTGLAGSTPAADRARGFADEMARHPQFRLLPPADGGWNAHGAAEAARRMLAEGQRPDFIFAHNDPMAAAVAQEMQARGHQPVIVGVDALNVGGLGLDLVEQGRIAATLIYPTAGDRVMDVALNILEGQPYERHQALTTALVTKDNVSLFRQQEQQMEEREMRLTRLGSQLNTTLSQYHAQRLLLILAVGAVLLALALFGVTLRAYWLKVKWNERLAQQNRLLEEQRDELVRMARHVEEVTQSKLNFFTNVSHDFRTPLTLIAGPLEQLQAKAQTDGEAQTLLAIARRNVAVMLRLVSQILDVRRMESGRMAMHLSRVPLAQRLDEWTRQFQPMATAHHISLTADTSSLSADGDVLWLDEEKVERICFNLLSNAFKFTPDGGHISLTAATTGTPGSSRLLTLRLSDSGRGMTAEQVDRVFDRFYQTDDLAGGSGIGLTVAQGFAQMHGGDIKAESAGPGQGATFVATLYEQPAPPDGVEQAAGPGAMHINPVELPSDAAAATACEAAAGDTANTNTNAAAIAAAPGTEEADANRPLLLVIDDNEDIRRYLAMMLAAQFRVAAAANGADGLAQARKLRPDLIVCDMMMPVMDGMACLKAIRRDEEIGCTPVVMLTACALDEERIAGYEGGADAYIAKPFSCAMLRARLLALCENRRRLRALMAQGTGLPEKLVVPNADKDFATKLRCHIEQHLADADYGVEEMARDMAYSRTQLYRKVKALTGLAPLDLLRKARLNRARECLQRGMASAEVAYATGFSSPSYFSKCYREEFGCTPTDAAARGQAPA